MPRALKPQEFDELRTKHRVGPANFADFFERRDGGIYFNPKDELVGAEDEYQQARKGYRAGLLEQVDLPALFKKAAKEANPNYGLSRSEILTRYNTPEFNDPKSGKYIDPNTRLAIADRERRGYAASMGETLDQVSNLFGKDVAARQFALEDAGGRLSGIQSAREKEADRLFDLQKMGQQFEYSKALKSTGSGSDGFKLSSSQVLQALAAGVDPNDPKAVADAIYGDKGTKRYDDFVKEISLPDNMSVDPQGIYRSYLEAQQAIDAQPDLFESVIDDPETAPYRHLLKPRTASSTLEDLFSGLYGG